LTGAAGGTGGCEGEFCGVTGVPTDDGDPAAEPVSGEGEVSLEPAVAISGDAAPTGGQTCSFLLQYIPQTRGWKATSLEFDGRG
jgi:hypothetical protein